MNLKRATALGRGEDADGRGSWMGSLPTGPHLGTAMVDISHGWEHEMAKLSREDAYIARAHREAETET